MTTKDSADYYQVSIMLDSNTLLHKDYYLSGQLKSVRTLKKQGNGFLFDGPIEDYYPGGQIHAQGAYKDNELHGALKSYYSTGKLKRIATYKNGKLKSGKMHDTAGKEIEYTEYERRAEPKFDVNKYLSRNIKYPVRARDNGKQGRVAVTFVVDTNGKIKSTYVRTPVDPDLDAESIRLINMMPDWSPAVLDDVPYEMCFTLPIHFRIDN